MSFFQRVLTYVANEVIVKQVRPTRRRSHERPDARRA